MGRRDYAVKMMPCTNCQKMVRVQRVRWETFKFCSKQCLSAWHNKTYRVTKECVLCGKSYSTPKRLAGTQKYCSQSCLSKMWYKKRGNGSFTCTICGKVVPISEYRASSRKTCSWECRLQVHRSDQPGKSGGVRLWMGRRGLLTECGRCGFSQQVEILVVHHKDRDRSNNSLDNLEVLCPNCHALEHYADGDKRLKTRGSCIK